MTNPRIRLTTDQAGGNANGWSCEGFERVECTSEGKIWLVLPTGQDRVDINNYSYQLATYQLKRNGTSQGFVEKFYGREKDEDLGSTHVLDYSDDVEIELKGSEGGAVFATLTMTKDGVLGTP